MEKHSYPKTPSDEHRPLHTRDNGHVVPIEKSCKSFYIRSKSHNKSEKFHSLPAIANQEYMSQGVVQGQKYALGELDTKICARGVYQVPQLGEDIRNRKFMKNAEFSTLETVEKRKRRRNEAAVSKVRGI